MKRGTAGRVGKGLESRRRCRMVSREELERRREVQQAIGERLVSRREGAAG